MYKYFFFYIIFSASVFAIDIPQLKNKKNVEVLTKNNSHVYVSIVIDGEKTYSDAERTKSLQSLSFLDSYYVVYIDEKNMSCLLAKETSVIAEKIRVTSFLGWVNMKNVLMAKIAMRLRDKSFAEDRYEKFIAEDRYEKSIQHLYFRVLSPPEKIYICSSRPIGNGDEKGKNTLPQKKYYVYDIEQTNERIYYLLGNQDEIKTKDEAAKVLLGWIPSENVVLCSSNVGLKVDKQSMKSKDQTWFEWRRKENRPIQVYTNKWDLLNSRWKKIDDVAAKEDFSGEKVWDHDVMRFLVHNKHRFSGQNAYEITILTKSLVADNSMMIIQQENQNTIDAFKKTLNSLRRVDLSLVIDTTGSMEPWIAKTKELIINISRDIQKSIQATEEYSIQEETVSNYIDLHISVTTYRDYDHKKNESYLIKLSPTTFDMTQENGINNFHNYMDKEVKCLLGDSWLEAPFEGIAATCKQKTFWRDGALKVVIVFGDCGHHPSGEPKTNYYHPNTWTKENVLSYVAGEKTDFNLYGIHMPESKEHKYDKFIEYSYDKFIEQIDYLATHTSGKFYHYSNDGGKTLCAAVNDIIKLQQQRVTREIETFLKNYDEILSTELKDLKNPYFISVKKRVDEIMEKDHDLSLALKSHSRFRYIYGWVWERDIQNENHRFFQPEIDVSKREFIAFLEFLDQIHVGLEKVIELWEKSADIDIDKLIQQCKDLMVRVILTHFDRSNDFFLYKNGQLEINNISDLKELVSAIPLNHSIFYQDMGKYLKDKKGPQRLKNLISEIDEKKKILRLRHKNLDKHGNSSPFYYIDPVTKEERGWIPQECLP